MAGPLRGHHQIMRKMAPPHHGACARMPSGQARDGEEDPHRVTSEGTGIALRGGEGHFPLAPIMVA